MLHHPAQNRGQLIVQTAKDLGVNANTLHTWIGKYSRPQSADKTLQTDERLYEKLKHLKKKMSG